MEKGALGGEEEEEEEVKIVGERKRKRNSSPMPTVKSPQKRTRKNSVGETNPPPGPGMDQATKEFLLAMEKRLSDRMDNVASRVQSNTEKIAEVQTDLEAKLADHKKETREEIDRAVRELGNVATGRLSRKQEEAYDLHRRSLRMWPVQGPNYAENIKIFLQKKLCLPSGFLADVGQIEFKRYFNTRLKTTTPAGAASTPPTNEMIVTFKTREIRDKIKSAGINLAGQSEAGLRIHVPGFLLDSFNALQSVGYLMKQKEADTRRSIKFDDNEHDLVMDVRIGGEWNRITAAHAKKVALENPDINAGPKPLDVAGITKFLTKK